jgi:hypothetical protein
LLSPLPLKFTSDLAVVALDPIELVTTIANQKQEHLHQAREGHDLQRRQSIGNIGELQVTGTTQTIARHHLGQR